MRKKELKEQQRESMYRFIVEQNLPAINSFFTQIRVLYAESANILHIKNQMSHGEHILLRMECSVKLEQANDLFSADIIEQIKTQEPDRAAILQTIIDVLTKGFDNGLLYERFSEKDIEMFNLFVLEQRNKFLACLYRPLDEKSSQSLL